MTNDVTAEQKLLFAETVISVLSTHSQQLVNPFIQILANLRAQPNQREIECIYNDLIEWCAGLSQRDRKDISESLAKKTGLRLDYFESNRTAKMRKITSRGIIHTDEEWRLLEERVQELSEKEEQVDEIKLINRMLASYKKTK